MRWILTSSSLLLAGLVLLGPAGAYASAAKTGKAEAAAGEPSKPIIYVEGKERFNINDPEDEKRLVERLKSGEAEHLTLEKESTFIEQVADLGIWTILVFIILLLILGRYAWKPILDGLHQREENIRASVEEAQRARDEARKIRADLEQKMANAQQDVQRTLDEGRRAAQRQYEEATAKAKAEIQAERERLHREIEGAKDQALQEIWNRTAEVAVTVTRKVLPRHLTADDQRRLVDDALAELPRTGNGRS